MHHIFISYSRRDRVFVERLSKALVDQGKDTWVDWEDIPPTATFMEEIRRAIDAGDSFLFVISPDSCRSAVCRQELAHAAKSSKRLIPIVCRETPDADVPPDVAPINWIPFVDGIVSDEALARLTSAIETDLKWVRAHTELLVRAKEWEHLGRARGALLRGVELTTAEQNLVTEAGKPPIVVPLQQELVVASRRNATRTLRNIVGAVSMALIVTAALAVLAFRLSGLAESRRQQAEEQRQTAEEQRNLAEVRRREADEQTVRAEQQRNRAEHETEKAEAATEVATRQRRVAESERNRAEDTARMMTAQSLADSDPTSAALLLLELHDPLSRGLAAVPAFRRVAEQSIASSVLRGHSSYVFSGAFSPDGQHVITASDDGTARIWRTDGLGKPVVLKGHEGKVLFAAYSPDGRSVITASDDRTARIWRANGLGSAVVLRGHSATVRSATLSRDGSRIITRSDDRTVRLWSANGVELMMARPPDSETVVRDAAFTADGLRVVGTTKNLAVVWTADPAREPVVLRGHTDAINSAEFSPDGTGVITSSNDMTVRLWPADGTGEPVVLRGNRSRVRSATISPDGSRVAAVSDDFSISVWAATGNGQPVVRRSPEYVMSLKFSPDGTRMATFADAKNFQLVWVWRTDGQEAPIVLAGHEGRVYSTAFSPDGTKVLTTGTDGTARVWPAAGSGEPLVVGNHQTWFNDARFDRTGTRIVTASDDKTARVWPLGSAGPATVLAGHAQRVATAVFSPEGGRVVTASDDGTARVWELAGRRPPIVLDGQQVPVLWAVFTSNGKQVVTASKDRTLRIWSLADPSTPTTLMLDDSTAEWTALSPDDSRALVSSEHSPPRLLPLTGADAVALPTRQGTVKSAFSPDGKRVLTASTRAPDTTVRVWTMGDRGDPVVLQGHSSPVVAAAFSPDGSRVVTASGDRTARIWSVQGRPPGIVLGGHTDFVWDASFSPDGTRVLTSAEDGTARIWNSDGRDQPAVLNLPADQNIVRHAAFSPDSSRVLTRTFTTSHRPNDVRVWRVGVAALMSFLRQSTTACLTPDVRRRALGESEALARSRFEACENAKTVPEDRATSNGL